jgi:hypothetical protein
MNEKLNNLIMSQLCNDYKVQTITSSHNQEINDNHFWLVNKKTNSTDVQLFFGTLKYAEDIKLFLDVFSLSKKQKEDIIKLFFIKLINEVYPIETEELNNIEYCKNGVDTYDYIKEMEDNCLRAMGLKG